MVFTNAEREFQNRVVRIEKPVLAKVSWQSRKSFKLHVSSDRFSFDPHSRVLFFVVVHFTTLLLSDYVHSVVGRVTGESLLWLECMFSAERYCPKKKFAKCVTLRLKKKFVTPIRPYM
jgi:hypothetical protein